MISSVEALMKDRRCILSQAASETPAICINDHLALYIRIWKSDKKVSSVNTSISRKREHRVLLMVITMVVFYLLCWLPYGIMALVATFGAPGLVTVEASIVPSILAKSSTVINPVIYIFMNKQVSE
ncbi:hypothetical protein DNTS_013971 [Danionella cerebrum]|uniref:G-protein coupled receptors family 1 profile domain-containing protein n=1 Tax=Danionella cerebrum TaxID=2873325 RepID=A0A553NAG8_9TELE|nr:hypothetical protein DNTS_013971 [Danionella translucida]